MRKWIPPVLILVTTAISVALYGRLPERVPTHWGIDGRPDGWSGPTAAAFGIPAIMVAMWALLSWLPRIDPRRESYEKFRGSYDLVVTTLMAFLGVLHVSILGFALGWGIDILKVAWIGVGVLFLVIGNVLPRARPNWFFGIRTPWTLSSDRVWERTHRVGGYVFVGGGLGLVLSAFAEPRTAFWVLFTTIGLASIGVIAYSYVLWRQERGEGGTGATGGE
jgi:uncharacterized membrane protein